VVHDDGCTAAAMQQTAFTSDTASIYNVNGMQIRSIAGENQRRDKIWTFQCDDTGVYRKMWSYGLRFDRSGLECHAAAVAAARRQADIFTLRFC